MRSKWTATFGVFLLVIMSASGLMGCEEEEPAVEPEEVEEEPEPEPEPEEEEEPEMSLADPSERSQELIDAIEGYTEWEHYEGADELMESGHPGDVWVIAYGNDTGLEAVADNTLPVPAGSIFVKVEHDGPEAEEPSAVTVMEKQSDEMGDWYWLKTDPDLEQVIVMDGMALEGPDVTGCVNCHGEQSEQDYLMLADFEL